MAVNPTPAQYHEIVIQQILEVKLLLLLFMEKVAKNEKIDETVLKEVETKAARLANSEVLNTIDIYMSKHPVA